LAGKEARSYLDILSADGEAGHLIAAFDWSSSGLGSPENWPQSLKTAVDLMLASPRPVSVIWGPDRIQLYNDAYIQIAGDRHPGALGRPAAETWADAYADFLGPILDRVFGGEPVLIDDHPVRLRRADGGAFEERTFSATFKPIRDETGAVAGVFHPLVETTAERQAEAAKRASEERLQLAVDGADLGTWDLDLGTDSATRSLRHDQMFGYRELQPKWGREIAERQVVEEDRPAFRQAFERALASGELACEVRVRWPDGSIHWIAPRGRVFYDDAGRPVRMAGVVQDVTARVEAEKTLRRSRAELSAIFEQATVGIAETDLAGRFVRVNDRYCAIVGRSREELLTLRMHEITHPGDLTDNAPLFSETVASGRPFEIIKRYVRPGGGTIWVHNNVASIRAPDGTIASLLAVTVDLTAQRAAEERLRELNETLESEVRARTAERNRVWEMSHDLFAIMGYDGYLKAINPAWTATLGFDEATLLGRPVSEQVHPDDQDSIGAMLEQLSRGASLSRFEDRLRHADGSWRWIAWSLVPGDDNVFYAVGRDVTAEKLAAADLAAAQEALRQSQKMEAMGQLTGGVAHDFNNLLTPIVGALDMLQRKGLGGAREQRLLAGAAHSAERAKTLVQRLLAFARRQPLQPTSVDVAELVTGMGDLIASTTGPQIKVVVDAARDLPPAKADPNQLEMAVLNLAVNARDAMPEGGTLRISVDVATIGRQHRSGLAPGRYLHLSVADTGVGMDDATLARAVEPFFSTKGVGKGTGLGLSMVHGLASQLGGAVTIRSTPGVGTNVELWLPQGEIAADNVAAAAGEDAPPIGRGTVLLVDDEDLIRLSTADMLIEFGYQVVEAASAEEALKLLNRGLRPDIVLTDHLMPGMSGTELARMLRHERPSTKVLIVSGYAETDGIAPDLPRLTKPFRSAELAASLALLS
jgi:PAS domain S-box-containing protein